MNDREKLALEALPKKQFWIEDDDYVKPHTFIELDQAIAALTDSSVTAEPQSGADEVGTVVQKWVEDFCVESSTRDYGKGLFFTENCIPDLVRRLAQPRPTSVNTVVSEDSIALLLADCDIVMDISFGIESRVVTHKIGVDSAKVLARHIVSKFNAPQPSQVSADAYAMGSVKYHGEYGRTSKPREEV